MSVTLYCGDSLAVLKTLPSESVQCVVTSPPYWGLRDYGVAGQLGLEPTPEAYVAKMVTLFAEVRRVLRDDGTLWLNIGDSYAAGAGGRGDAGREFHAVGTGPASQKHGGARIKREVAVGLKPKDLVGIPWRLAFALQADGWWLRSDIIWAKPNPMPESVTDRPTKAHEYLFLLTKSEQYYYDAAAISEPLAVSSIARLSQENFDNQQGGPKDYGPDSNRSARKALENLKRRRSGNKQRDIPSADDGRGIPNDHMGRGRNARTVWTIATQPYPAAHFATFPEELARRCIAAGSAARACERCGAPWERVTDGATYYAGLTDEEKSQRTRKTNKVGNGHGGAGRGPKNNLGGSIAETVGWQPTCDCTQEGTGRSVVLDPFGGSGTVAQVATGNGRDSIYIDLNPAYVELAKQRIGPMLCKDAA